MSESSRFQRPGPDDVHVWWIDLRASALDDLVLSSDERARAKRFCHDRDRLYWTRAHVALRHILGGYLGLPPEAVRFDSAGPLHAPAAPIALGEGMRGVRAATIKPSLLPDPRLRFNLAHAGGRAVLAVAWERDVGIDLELIDPHLNMPPLARFACSPGEIARLEALSPDKRIGEFLALWTLKEAYLKAIGVGLFRDPRELEIERLSHDKVRIRDAQAGESALAWELRGLDAGPGWVAALAVEGANVAIKTGAWPAGPNAPSSLST